MESNNNKDYSKLKDYVYFFTIENKLKFGNPNLNAIIGKIISVYQDKSIIKEVISEFNSIKEEIKNKNNKDLSLLLNELKQKLKIHEKQKKQKDLLELPNVDVNFTTRIPPEPSKYLHIGHAISFLINYLYAKKYKGKTILRFEDTNPEKSTQEYVDADLDDILNYLEIKPNKIIYVSDDMNKFYEHAEILINQGKAYVCSCNSEEISKNRQNGIECKCRSRSIEENKELWQRMLNKEFNKGEVCLRLKINMKAKNYVMRDPVIFRINYTEHYRQKNKYCVWPLYDFENSLEDSWNNVTHILRSAEFGKMREELQNYIKDLFGLRKQTIIQYGRFNVINNITQGRTIRELIKSKRLEGWDDIRLVTLKALKRRGILKETLYDLTKQIGLSKTPTNIDYSIIAKLNRIHLDKQAKRLFALKNPIEIKFVNFEENIESLKEHYNDLKTRIPLHPDLDLGFRELSINNKTLIDKKDYDNLEENKIYRLMDGFNFYKQNNEYFIDSISYDDFRKKSNKASIIQWLPNLDSEIIKIDYIMPNSDEIEFDQRELIKSELTAEKYVNSLKQDEIIQFVRLGFFKLEYKSNNLNDKKVFIFSHK